MDDLNYDFDAALNDLKMSFLENENKELKNRIFELENNISLEGKLELYEKNKILTKENNLLKERNANLIDILNILEKENNSLNSLKPLTESCIAQMSLYEKQIDSYKNKKKKPKKKKYKVSDLIKLKNEGYSYKEIADKYNVSPSTIHYRINKVIKK